MSDTGDAAGLAIEVDVAWSGRVRTLPFTALTGTLGIVGREAYLKGWSLVETTGSAAATIEIHNGGSAAGDLVAVIALSAGESTRDWLADTGVCCDSGVFLAVTAGSVRGAIWARVPR